MRSVNYVPSYAKSVVHEARNAILMCKSHHSAFERYMFYIRWIPQVRRHPAKFMHITDLIKFRPTSSSLSTIRRGETMNLYMENCFISTPIPSNAPSPLPSYGMSAEFVDFILPVVIAMSPSTLAVYKMEVRMMEVETPDTMPT